MPPVWTVLWCGVTLLLIACTDRDLTEHAPNAKLRSITMERRADTSEDWVVESRMDYHYDSLGHEIGKAFYQKGPADTFTLALQYQIEFPDSSTRIELREDCDIDSCRFDSRRVWVKDSLGDEFTDSTYRWDSHLMLWRIYYVQRHSRDRVRKKDTLWQEENGRVQDRILTTLQSNNRVIEVQTLDSAGRWFTVERENCRMQGKHPVYCKAGGAESWITYTAFDSIAVQRYKTATKYSSVTWDYDSHGHWIGTTYSDTDRIVRDYR